MAQRKQPLAAISTKDAKRVLSVRIDKVLVKNVESALANTEITIPMLIDSLLREYVGAPMDNPEVGWIKSDIDMSKPPHKLWDESLSAPVLWRILLKPRDYEEFMARAHEVHNNRALIDVAWYVVWIFYALFEFTKAPTLEQILAVWYSQGMHPIIQACLLAEPAVLDKRKFTKTIDQARNWAINKEL